MALLEANDILLELILLVDVDTDTPPTREITKKLNDFASAVSSNGSGTRQQVLSLGAYAIVCRAWIFCCYSGVPKMDTPTPTAKKCRDAVLRCLYALTAGYPEIIDDVGWQIITHTLENSNNKPASEQTLILLLKLLRNIFIKSEPNREYFTWSLKLMDSLLSVIIKPRPSSLLIREFCGALKALILCDDVRDVYNRAPERKRMISKSAIPHTLAGHLHHHEYVNDEGTLNAIVIFLGSMAINDEMCIQIEAGNVLPGIHSIFRTHFHNKTLIRNTLYFLKCLCVNPFVREKSSTFALMKWVLDVIAHYKKEKDVVEMAMAACAFMTLRNSCQVAQFLARNGLQQMLQTMIENPSNLAVLKSACITLRNAIDSGGPDTRDKIKETKYIPFLTELLGTVSDLKEFHLKPILKELGASFKRSSISSKFNTLNLTTGRVESPETILFEPQSARKSVMLDEVDDD